MVRTLLFHCNGHEFSSGRGAKITHVPLCSQKNNKTNQQQQQNPKAYHEVKPQFEETDQALDLDMGGFSDQEGKHYNYYAESSNG